MRVARCTRLLAVALLALTGCGADDEGDAGAAGRFLPAQAQQVVAISLDYDGEDWEGIKKLYARAARSGAVREFIGTEGPVPSTLDGALNLAAGFSGLSFQDDIRPLLGGRVLIATHVTPAPPLPADVRRTLERFDPDATDWGEERPKYFDRDGRPMPENEVEAALRAQDRLREQTETVLAYQAPDAEAVKRVVAKATCCARSCAAARAATRRRCPRTRTRCWRCERRRACSGWASTARSSSARCATRRPAGRCAAAPRGSTSPTTR